jgi:hypothetical protein
MQTIIDRSEMQIAGNKHDPLDIVRIDETLERVPLGLISSPTVGKLARWIGDDRSEDDLPGGGRGQEAVFQPL